MLEKLKEFKDTLSERIKSPFIGSLMITWVVLHWKVLALLIYNEENITIQQRIDKIDLYLKDQKFSDLILYPALITLGVLFCYSILNAIGLFIKLLYDNWASPYIQKFLNNNNIIEKTKYDKIKREYATVKKDYDEDKVNYINGEKERRELKNNFEALRNNSFVGEVINDITSVFKKGVEWENFHTYKDGKTGSEIFTTDFDSFNLTDGKRIKIDNIKITSNGKILSFDKIIEDKAIPNNLIRDREYNYHGIEGDQTLITYRKKKDRQIVIHSAKYNCGQNFIDVTLKINKLVENNVVEFIVSNELMGGDPGFQIPKTFNIEYSIDNITKSHTFQEHSIVRIE